jgi:hypothetical protein
MPNTMVRLLFSNAPYKIGDRTILFLREFDPQKRLRFQQENFDTDKKAA